MNKIAEHPLTRRQFLITSGAVGAGVYARGMIGRAVEALADSGAPSLTLMLFRREDMVWLQYSFYNLVLQPQKGSAPPQLIRETAGADAFIVVALPAQHVAEGVVDATTSGPGAGQILTKVSDASQIAFLVPANIASIDCTEQSLLDWQTWTMQIVGPDTTTTSAPSYTAAPPPAPGPVQTDLQVVDHLHLTPDSDSTSTWVSASDPVTSNGRTELWGTRLVPRTSPGGPGDDSGTNPASIRAVSYYGYDASKASLDLTYDFGIAGHPVDVRQVFKNGDAHDIYVATNMQGLTPASGLSSNGVAPAEASMLMLTALGAWLEIEGHWEESLTAVPIAEWRHRSTQGRDNFVKIVDRGFLFPFGHRAELITISERQVHGDGVAYVYQKSYVRVKQPTVSYPGYGQLAPGTQEPPFPFTDVTLLTLVTPDILPASSTNELPGPGGPAFWVEIDSGGASGGDVPWHLVASDHAGNQIDFTSSLAFVAAATTNGGYDPSVTGPIVKYYNYDGGSGLSPTDPRRLINLAGQKIAFAPERTAGDSSHPTSQLVLGAAQPAGTEPGTSTPLTASDFAGHGAPAFAPVMTAAQVRVPAVESLQGGAPAPPTPPGGSSANNQQPLISYAYSYVLHGTGPADPTSATTTQKLTDNAGGLFAMVTDPADGGFAGSLEQAIGGAVKAASDSQAYVTHFEANIGAAISQAGGASYLDGLPAKQAIDKLQSVSGYATAIAANSGVATSAAALAGMLTGGVAVPNLSIGALAQSLGPLSGQELDGLTSAAQGFVNPAKFFSPSGGFAEAQILGSIPLLNVLPTNIPFVSSASGGSPNAPKIQTTIVYPNGDKTKPPTGTMTVLDWSPRPTSWGPLFFPFTDPDNTAPDDVSTWTGPGPLKSSDANATFLLHVVIQTFLDGSPPTYQITGTLTNFVMDLLEPSKDYASKYPTSAAGGSQPDGPSFIVITFNRFAFTAKSGQKPNFSVDIADVTFDGPLAFIETLEQFLSSLGDGLAIDVKPTAISASLSLPIPAVTAGVIALQNLSFGASLLLPFTGDPFRIGANFCTRENPFLVTIMCLGGGGYIGVQLGPDGLQVVEASIEVAASAAIDIGIASGSVTLAIGIYFKLEQQSNGTDEVTLTGYFQANGSVSVLGLVTISLEIYLGMTYMGPPPVVLGEATITLTVEIGPFSKSFSASVQRQFAGGDPPSGLTFGQQMTHSDWNTYCDAFAN